MKALRNGKGKGQEPSENGQQQTTTKRDRKNTNTFSAVLETHILIHDIISHLENWQKSGSLIKCCDIKAVTLM